MKEAGDHVLFYMAWMVRGEVLILVSVDGLFVDADIKRTIILVVEDSVQE